MSAVFKVIFDDDSNDCGKITYIKTVFLMLADSWL